MQETLAFFQNNAETIIAVCALFVSVTSILIGYSSLKSQQQHNRLSVKPIGDIRFITSEDSIEIQIRNDGTGPMICPKVTVYNKESGETGNNLRDAIPILQGRGDLVRVDTDFKFTLPAGEQKTMLRISTEDVTPEFRDYRDQVLAALKKIVFEFEVRDIYENHIETIRRERFSTG